MKSEKGSLHLLASEAMAEILGEEIQELERGQSAPATPSAEEQFVAEIEEHRALHGEYPTRVPAPRSVARWRCRRVTPQDYEAEWAEGGFQARYDSSTGRSEAVVVSFAGR